MSTNLDLQPVAEVRCGRLRWHVSHPNYFVPLKFLGNDTHLLYDRETVDAAVAAERERIALAWDGCIHEGTPCDVDIGASIRAGELVPFWTGPNVGAKQQ